MLSRIGSMTLAIGFIASAPALAGKLKVPQQFATIQAAVTAAGAGDEVIVSHGNYAEQVTIDAKTDVIVRAKVKVKVTGDPTAAPLAAFGVINVSACVRVVLRGFTIAPDAVHSGIRCDVTTDCRIEKCSFVGGVDGVIASAAFGFVVSDCSVRDTSFKGIFIAGTSGRVTRCDVSRPGDDGISVDFESGEVSANRVDDGPSNGIDLVGTGTFAVFDNRISNVGETGVAIDDHVVSHIERNQLKRCGTGISAFGDATTIERNEIDRAVLIGIAAFNPNLVVNANRIQRCTAGLHVAQFAAGDVFRANVIRDSAANGIEIQVGASHDTFIENDVKGSGLADLLNSAGTANTFIDNRFGTVSP